MDLSVKQRAAAAAAALIIIEGTEIVRGRDGRVGGPVHRESLAVRVCTQVAEMHWSW